MTLYLRFTSLTRKKLKIVESNAREQERVVDASNRSIYWNPVHTKAKINEKILTEFLRE
jgi:hypothetical protein